MNHIPSFVSHAEAGLISVTTPEGLSAIHQTDCAAVIWQRQPLPAFQRWIDALPADQLPRLRTALRPARVAEALETTTQVCGTPMGQERDMLVGDISAMAAIFADVMSAPYLRLRLDVVTTNDGRKLHIDALTARLICTYRGTGTQYGTGQGGDDPSHIHTTPTGAPLILRGTQWPERPAADLLHRSPPIENSGETRLVLVLDPVADLENAPDPITFH